VVRLLISARSFCANAANRCKMKGSTSGPRSATRNHIEENDTTFAIGWKGRYRIEGPAFIYVDHDTGQLSSRAGFRLVPTRPGSLDLAHDWHHVRRALVRPLDDLGNGLFARPVNIGITELNSARMAL
jgi:hypothetical protein